MAIVKPFKAFRPKKEIAHLVASLPYDVLSSEEARELAKNNPLSFLHVTKPEIDLDPSVDIYSNTVYQKAKENLEKFISDGTFFQDEKPCYYIYAQTLWGRTQYGIVGGASVEDYYNKVIKEHELTRPDKEDDRLNHIRITGFHAEPVFFAFPDNKKLQQIINNTIIKEPEYYFTAEDGITHSLWVVDEDKTIKEIENTFKNEIPFVYVADGHHRTAAAARYAKERKESNPSHTGEEEYNYFVAVHFPASHLKILDYNRVIKDLNGLTVEEFINKLKEHFEIIEVDFSNARPEKLHQFSMYINNKWYKLNALPHTYNDNDPIDSLDVTVLTKFVLDPILDIKDLRKSKRIDFVGGIRGLKELEKRVDSGEMVAAFALYPVSMDQLIKIADTGNIMPPKTTWFEPKLRSGLFLHKVE